MNNSRFRHLCLDMQRLFAPEGPWPTPWMPRVLPAIVGLVERAPQKTIFTRFITPKTPDDAGGMWRPYYMKWRDVTRDRIDPELLELVPPLQAFVPPAEVFDKTTYSAFADNRLHRILQQASVNSLIVTGAETDVCVLSTVLDAVDLGYRTIIVANAVCSSSDESHDGLIEIYRRRFSIQIELMNADQAGELLRSEL
jgi:nicotinamidase-related amidase